MSARTQRAKLIPLGGAAITYLFRDEFTSAASAPLSSPRAAEPGPGTLVLVQNDGQFSIASGAFTFPTQTTAAWGDQRFYEDTARTRVIGRALLTESTFSALNTASYLAAWAQSNNPALAVGGGIDNGILNASSGALYVAKNGAIVFTGYVMATSTSYQTAVVLRSAGAFYFIKGGAFTNWTLLYVDYAATDNSLYPMWANFNDAGSKAYFRVRDIGGVFAGDFSIASVNVAAPAHLTTYVATADQIVELDITAPGSLAEECGVRYRILDANNYWRAYFNNAGAFRVDSVSSGTPTNRINVAGVISAGQTVTVRAICEGSVHDAFTSASGTDTKRGTQISVSHQNTQTAIAADIGSGWSVANLRSYPRTSLVYNELDRV